MQKGKLLSVSTISLQENNTFESLRRPAKRHPSRVGVDSHALPLPHAERHPSHVGVDSHALAQPGGAPRGRPDDSTPVMG